jgi:AcrR family transcriptional regulator
VAVKRRGRRPGPSETREGIADAARRQFAELGYDRTTIRSIAGEAEVDPALVIHYFASKQQLFLAVVELPFEPEEDIPRVVEGPRATVGDRLARFVLGVLEDPVARAKWTGMIRAAASEPEAARMLRELLERRVFAPLARALDSDEPALRANLVGSQVVGLVMARYIVAVEPIASVGADDVAAAIAPTLQRYLVGPL